MGGALEAGGGMVEVLGTKLLCLPETSSSLMSGCARGVFSAQAVASVAHVGSRQKGGKKGFFAHEETLPQC